MSTKEEKRIARMIEQGRKDQERLRLLRETPAEEKPEAKPKRRKRRGRSAGKRLGPAWIDPNHGERTEKRESDY